MPGDRERFVCIYIGFRQAHWHTKKEPQRYNDDEERVIHRAGERIYLGQAKSANSED